MRIASVRYRVGFRVATHLRGRIAALRGRVITLGRRITALRRISKYKSRISALHQCNWVFKKPPVLMSLVRSRSTFGVNRTTIAPQKTGARCSMKQTRAIRDPRSNCDVHGDGQAGREGGGGGFALRHLRLGRRRRSVVVCLGTHGCVTGSAE